MIYDYYIVDKDGYIKERYRLEEDDPFIKFKGLIKAPSETFAKARYDSSSQMWVEDLSINEIMEVSRKSKINEMTTLCSQNILKGFNYTINEKLYHFSYDLIAQQNFSDTMRLFENNMIDEIGWNAYRANEKNRIKVDKKAFTELYLSGVKHKNSQLSKLNDVMIPLISSAKTVEEISNIKWDNNVEADDFLLNNSKTIARRTEILEVNNKQAMSGILELTTLFLMGGF